MKKLSLLLIIPILSSIFLRFSLTEEPALFSAKIDSFLNEMNTKYKEKASDSAWNYYPVIKQQLIGSKMDDFDLKDVDGIKISLNSIKTPLIIDATASWCAPCVASIPVINKLAKKYDGKVKFLLITHDEQGNAKKLSKKYNSNIIIIPATESKNLNNMVKSNSGKFKHIFPYPTAYFINKDKAISAIKSGGAVPGSFPISETETMNVSKKEAFETNLKILESGIAKIVENK